MKLTKNQKKVVSEILVNFGIASLSIGVISQFVFEIKNYFAFFLCLFIYILSSILSIFVVK